MAEKIGRNFAKVRKATAHPKRPGEECTAAPGAYRPVINIGKCEGKKDCAEVCPYDVFEITKIKPEDYAALGFFRKLKSKAHGGIAGMTTEDLRAIYAYLRALPPIKNSVKKYIPNEKQ